MKPRRSFNYLVLPLVFVVSVLSASAGSAATPAEKAARVDAIFQSLQEHPPEGTTLPKNSILSITEDELNAYIDQTYRSKPKGGLRSASVKLLNENRVSADGVINVEDLKTENSMALKMITLLFSGDQALHVEAKLLFQGNTVFYELERAQLNKITLPNLLVEKLIEILARKQSQKTDVTKPVPLSSKIKHVEIRQGVLLIKT
jgi:hypothetical protein